MFVVNLVIWHELTRRLSGVKPRNIEAACVEEFPLLICIVQYFSITWHPGFSICVRDDWDDYFQQTGSSDSQIVFFLRGASRPEQLDQANQLTVYKQKTSVELTQEGQEGPRAPHQRHRLAYPIPCPQLVFCFNSKNVRNLRCKAMSNLNFNSRCCKRGSETSHKIVSRSVKDQFKILNSYDIWL